MDIRIVVVTYNSAEALTQLFNSIDSDLKSRMLVIDNASQDDTKQLVNRNGIRLIELEENYGFSKAANIGARSAESRFVCFLNPDCLIYRQLVIEGIKYLENKPIACAVPLFHSGDEVVSGKQHGYTWLKLVADMWFINYGDNAVWRWLKKRRGFHNANWEWPYGTCLFIERELFLDLGGFDEQYFVYGEDIDFGQKLSKVHGDIIEIPMVVRHLVGKSTNISDSERVKLLNNFCISYGIRSYGLPFTGMILALSFPSRLRSLLPRIRHVRRQRH